MDLTFLKRLKAVDFAALFICSVIWGYVFVGFFYPAPHMFPAGMFPRAVLWFFRIALPVLLLGCAALIINLRLGRIHIGEVVLLLIVSALSLFICYEVADRIYQARFERSRQAYHPYLQLMPTFDDRLKNSAPETIRVFCLGGSTTEFADTHGRDWPSRVETLLRTTYGLKNVEVYNLGRAWYTSLHTLINYETNLRVHRPSVLLIMQSVNDLLHNAEFSYFSHGAFREDYGHFYGPVNRIIDRRSLWTYLGMVLNELWYAKPRREVTATHFPGLTPFVRNMQTIVELAKQGGSTVIFMTEPCLVRKEMSEDERAVIGMIRAEAVNDTLVWSTETIRSGMEQYNGALKRLAAENGLMLIDLEQSIPKSLTYFTDEVHYRDTTFTIVAPVVAAKLYEQLSAKGSAH